MELRNYQKTQLSMLRQGVASKQWTQMLMSPTGSGKTEVAKAIIKGAHSKGKRAWFIVDGVKLLDQTLSRFMADGITAGAIQSDHPCTDHSLPIQVATIQSLRPRLQAMLNNRPPQLVVIDEAHVIHQAHIELIEWCKAHGVPVIGLSATPFRRGLGLIFNRLVACITTRELTEQGFLVPTECYVPSVPSLKGVKTAANGDWIEDELAQVMEDAQIVGDVVSHWKELGENRQTLVFACNVAHSKQLAEAFFNAGVMAAHIDGYMDGDEQDEIIRLYKAGKIKVLVSVGMLSKGFDDPATSCIVLARPTKSLMLHYQMLGRVLRTFMGKKYGIIIDHAGNLLRNGKPCDELPDQLDTGEGDPIDRRKQDQQPEEKKERACPQCKFMYSGLLCPKCGHEVLIKDGVAVANGKLVKLEDRKTVIGPNNKQKIFGELLQYARDKGKKDAWAQYAYQAFMGEPIKREFLAVEPVQTSPEISQWVKGYNVRRAKSKQRFG